MPHLCRRFVCISLVLLNVSIACSQEPGSLVFPQTALEQIAEIQKRIGAPDGKSDIDRDSLKDFVRLAELLHSIGEEAAYTKIVDGIHEFIEAIEARGGKSHYPRYELASLFIRTNRAGDAIPILMSIQAERPELWGVPLKTVEALVKNGQFDEAISEGEKHLAKCQKEFPVGHESVVGACSILALCYSCQHSYQKAELAARKAHELAAKYKVGLTNKTSINSMTLALVLHAQGKTEEAAPYFDSALSMSQKQNVQLSFLFGLACLASDRDFKGGALLHAWATAKESKMPAPLKDNQEAWLEFADQLVVAQQFNKAESIYKEIQKHRTSHEDVVNDTAILPGLAYCLVMQEKHDEAESVILPLLRANRIKRLKGAMAYFYSYSCAIISKKRADYKNATRFIDACTASLEETEPSIWIFSGDKVRKELYELAAEIHDLNGDIEVARMLHSKAEGLQLRR